VLVLNLVGGHEEKRVFVETELPALSLITSNITRKLRYSLAAYTITLSKQQAAPGQPHPHPVFQDVTCLDAMPPALYGESINASIYG
jgi:hypothetical protein